MANYSLTINSKFKPFSYQELLAPALMSTQAHQATAEAFAELSTKANIWDKMANETTDPKAYSIYKKYATDLAAQSEQLAKYGMTPTSMQTALDMKSRYAKDIVPIETAYKKREEDIKAQKETMLKDPTHFFNRKASEVSLDEYLDNPKLDVMSDNYSGALLQQQVSQAAASLKSAIMKKGAITSLGLPYQYERALQKGATPDEVLAAMAKDPNALPILNKLVEYTMASSGIRNWSSMNGDWANNPMYKRAEAYARQGLMSAIGTTDYQTFKDEAGLARLHADLQDRNNARQHARQVAEAKRREAAADATRRTRLNPLPLRSPKQIDASKKEINHWIELGYFKQNSKGEYVLTPKGNQAMQEGIKAKRSGKQNYSNLWKNNVTYKGGEEVTLRALKSGKIVDTTFYDFMTKINGGEPFYNAYFGKNPLDIKQSPYRAGKLFSDYMKNNEPGSYDTYHSTEYDRQLSSEYGNRVKEQLWAASGTRKGERVLIPVEFNGKNGWKEGKPLTADDLKGYTATNIRYSKWGNTAILQKDGADPIRVKVPGGVNLWAEGRVGTAIADADDYGLILSKGLQPKTVIKDGELVLDRDKKGNIKFTNTPLTDNDKAVFYQYQREALDEMNTSGSQLVVESETEKEKYGNFNY